MKRIRKTFTVLVSALVIALMSVFSAACGEDDEKPNDDGGNVTYTVTIERTSGDPFTNTLIVATGPTAAYGRTDSDGTWSFTGPKGTYSLEFDVPEGYVGKSTSYKISDANKDQKFTLSASLISTPAPAAQSYDVGSVMHDFSFTDTNGNEGSLAALLAEKRAVILNFWFINCTYCLREFPGLEAAYELYKDKLEVVGLNFTDTSAESEVLRQGKSPYYDGTLTFPTAANENACAGALYTAFSGTGCPMTVVIDSEAVVCAVLRGEGSAQEFLDLFEMYTADDYEQIIQFPDRPAEKPDVAAPTSYRISQALCADGFEATFWHDPDEYNWPFVVGDDGKSLKASNSKHHGSYAILYADFTAEAGQILAFDYKTSTEEDGDLFTIFVDNELIYSYSGVMDDYKTCYAYIPVDAGDYTLALTYTKDANSYDGEDTVYIKNMRFVDSVGERTEIPYRCATGGIGATGAYNKYITPVYNSDDGYYHVGTKTGPLVLADLLNECKWSDHTAWSFITGENSLLVDLDGDGTKENYTQTFSHYVTVSNNSRKYGKIAVTQELKESLDALMKVFGSSKSSNEWLDLCYYYNVYGGKANEQIEDPALGLAMHNAYDAQITAKGEELILNHVNKETALMPRGMWYKVVPEKTSIYRIRSVGEVDTFGWLADADGDFLADNDNDTNPSNKEYYNFTITWLLQKDTTYYVLVDFNNVDYLGECDFVVEELNATGTVWTTAALGEYTAIVDEDDNIIGVEVGGAVDYVLGADDCYHVKNPDGSAGALIYVNLLTDTDIFPSTSVEAMLGIYGYYCKDCGSKYPASVKSFESASSVVCYCGNTVKSRFEKKLTFELPTALTKPNGDPFTCTFQYASGDDYQLYQLVPMYNLIDGEGNPYKGSISSDAQYVNLLKSGNWEIAFTDYTETVRKYVDLANNDDNCASDPDEVGGLQGGTYSGFVPAKKELVDVLQKLILFGDYAMSPNLDNAWLMMASYFMTLA